MRFDARRVRLLRGFLIALILGMMGVDASYADSIDGTWCSERDHHQMTIKGTEAFLPGGRRVTGEYSRHRFSYLIPVPDAEAGRITLLRLMGERTMMSVSAKPDGTEPSEPENWKRCELTS
jgi:hypothetical protein